MPHCAATKQVQTPAEAEACTCNVEPPAGLEPATCGLQGDDYDTVAEFLALCAGEGVSVR